MFANSSRRVGAILASLSAGAFLAALILLNSGLGKRIGVLESSFMAHLTGSFLAFIIIAGRIKKIAINNTAAAPKYLFIGGILGIIITLVGNVAAPVIGLLLHLALLTTLDLILSAAADHFGLFGLPRFRIDAKRGLGLILSILGVILIFWS